MNRLAGLLLLGIVAGCARQPGVVEECQAAANDDPAVKAFILKGVGNPHAMLEDQDRLRAARQDATVACLRRRGVVRAGGVERQKPL